MKAGMGLGSKNSKVKSLVTRPLDPEDPERQPLDWREIRRGGRGPRDGELTTWEAFGCI